MKNFLVAELVDVDVSTGQRLYLFNTMRFFLGGYLKDIVFKESCASIMQLQNRIQEACAGITKAMYRKVCHSMAH